MKKYAIYTVLTDLNYDSCVRQPLVVDERFDYILFTKYIEGEQIGVWKLRKIEYDNVDTILVSRYPKLNPEIVLPNYETTLYIDANIQIVDNTIYERFIYHIQNGSLWASLKNTIHTDLYQELYTLPNWLYEHDYKSFRWCHFLRKQGYPIDNGLFENNVIFRRNCDIVNSVDKMWWRLVQTISHRDQYSLMYCLWKCELKPQYYFEDENENTRNSIHFKYLEHGKGHTRKFINMGFFERVRMRTRTLSIQKELESSEMFYKLSILPFPNIVLWIWGLCAAITNVPLLTKNFISHHS